MGGGRIITERAIGDIKVDGRMRVLVNPEIIEKYGTLTVGFVKQGELITPFGMKKEVKIKDLFSIISLPNIIRDTLPVVRAGAVPVWIPGLRPSECLRIPQVKEKLLYTENALLLTFKDGLQLL